MTLVTPRTQATLAEVMNRPHQPSSTGSPHRARVPHPIPHPAPASPSCPVTYHGTSPRWTCTHSASASMTSRAPRWGMAPVAKRGPRRLPRGRRSLPHRVGDVRPSPRLSILLSPAVLAQTSQSTSLTFTTLKTPR